ncbi:hypothetical protein TNCV_2163761 [Trichonephila clavipes]|nr:hypothetical protein TNCV_2163761 [Trichonephila clavipes]
MSSSLVPLKTHRVGKRCPLNLSRDQTFSRCCGVVVRTGGQLRCSPRHLTMAQNYEVRHQKPSSRTQCDINIHSLTHSKPWKQRRAWTDDLGYHGRMFSCDYITEKWIKPRQTSNFQC